MFEDGPFKVVIKLTGVQMGGSRSNVPLRREEDSNKREDQVKAQGTEGLRGHPEDKERKTKTTDMMISGF